MCTVTIIPLVDPEGRPAGLRLATNRDESRQRAPAIAPQFHERGGLRSIWPIDPVGGGTWVGVNEAGLVATLLNRNDGSPRATHPAARSRGEIVPLLLTQENAVQAAEHLSQIDAGGFLPFTVICADSNTLVRGTSSGGEIAITRSQREERPVMFTSSGLGDALVEPPRRKLFDDWFAPDAVDWRDRQNAFHRHQWSDATHLSVCMSRADARTVSLTVVEVEGTQVRLAYWAHSPDESGEPTTSTLPRRGASL